jgi:hypothetical protein
MYIPALTDGLILLAGAFLFFHLLTDARRMVQVLRLEHFQAGHWSPTTTCFKCDRVRGGVKEAWWEVITLGALVGHLAFDFWG